MAYSLMGIFDVSMPILYGEGVVNAHQRHKDEIYRSHKAKSQTQVMTVANSQRLER